MASIKKYKKRKLFRVSFKDPYTNKWKERYYKTKQEALSAKATFDYIDNMKKIGSDDWKKVVKQPQEELTLEQLVKDYRSNFLANKTNKGTIKRRNACIRAMYRVFAEETTVREIRSLKRTMIPDGEKQGWEIFKSHHAHLSRHTINGYLTELKAMFDWARMMERIDFVVINKLDKYTDDELPEITHLEWKPSQAYQLLYDDHLTQYHKDYIKLFTLTGLRISELLGQNTDYPEKEFKWKHVNFETNELSIRVKRKKFRLVRTVHEDVMAILRKWKDKGFERPLDFKYSYVRNHIIPQVNMALGFKFTTHDLRRLNAQLARPVLGLEDASKSIGDSTLLVVEKHYAGISSKEMTRINNAVVDQLATITQTATA